MCLFWHHILRVTGVIACSCLRNHYRHCHHLFLRLHHFPQHSPSHHHHYHHHQDYHPVSPPFHPPPPSPPHSHLQHPLLHHQHYQHHQHHYPPSLPPLPSPPHHHPHHLLLQHPHPSPPPHHIIIIIINIINILLIIILFINIPISDLQVKKPKQSFQMFQAAHFPGSDAELFYIKHRLCFFCLIWGKTHRTQSSLDRTHQIHSTALHWANLTWWETSRNKSYFTLTVCEDTLTKTACIKQSWES